MPSQYTSNSTVQNYGSSQNAGTIPNKFSDWIVGNTGTVTTSNLTNSTSINLNYSKNNLKYVRDGELYIDVEGESFIYFSDSDKWVKCEIEEIRKETDIKGVKRNVFVISFECTVSEMKKREQERCVLTEKVKKPIIIFNTSTITTGAIDWTNHTINMPQWIYTDNIIRYGTTNPNPLITTTINQAVPLGITNVNPVGINYINTITSDKNYSII